MEGGQLALHDKEAQVMSVVAVAAQENAFIDLVAEFAEQTLRSAITEAIDQLRYILALVPRVAMVEIEALDEFIIATENAAPALTLNQVAANVLVVKYMPLSHSLLRR